MPDHSNRRRFIAGAVCPRCAKMDKIVVDPDTDQRECVACGYSEARPQAADQEVPVDRDRAPAGEIPTRVSRAAARRVETPAEVVTLIDPDKVDK